MSFLPGYKKFEVLPDYINNSDLCIVPYNENIHIQYSTPTKFLDYLASGLPIVSTNFIDAKNYKDLIYIANNKIEFSNYFKIALKAVQIHMILKSNVKNMHYKIHE